MKVKAIIIAGATSAVLLFLLFVATTSAINGDQDCLRGRKEGDGKIVVNARGQKMFVGNEMIHGIPDTHLCR